MDSPLPAYTTSGTTMTTTTTALLDMPMAPTRIGPSGSQAPTNNLNPLATPFSPPAAAPPHPPTTTSTNTRPKPINSRKKGQISPPNLELEYANIQINTAQATITVLETTVNDLRFRNEILEDRIKQMEGLKKKEIFEQYFPSHNTTRQSQSISPPLPGSGCCCHHLHSAFHPGFVPQVPINNSQAQIQAALDSISSLKSEVNAIQSTLNQVLLSLGANSSSQAHTSSPTSPSNVPHCSEAQSLHEQHDEKAEHSQAAHDHQQDHNERLHDDESGHHPRHVSSSSVVTVDEDMNDSELDIDLNCE